MLVHVIRLSIGISLQLVSSNGIWMLIELQIDMQLGLFTCVEIMEVEATLPMEDDW